MDNNSKVDSFSKLHNLLIFYSEYRDQPVNKDFDFFYEVKSCCEELELDYEEFIKKLELK